MRSNKLINLVVLPLAVLCCGVASAQMDITTWQVNTSHTGVNPTEQALTPGRVQGSGNLSCLFAEQVDGQVNAQPLYLTKKTTAALPGTFADQAVSHNVVYVATQNGSIYAIDADLTTDSCSGVHQNYLWAKHLASDPQGVTPGGVVETLNDVGGTGDITPLLGLTETPVIDPTTGTLFVVVDVKDASLFGAAAPFGQILYALDVKTGAIKAGLHLTPEFNGDFSSPQTCTANATICEAPKPSGPGKIPFFPEHEHLRASLTLDSVHQTLYMAFASHNDQSPYWGEVLGYNISDLKNITLQGQFMTTPVGNTQAGGIWMGGASPALDPQTNQLFVATGNGQWTSNQAQSGKDSGGQLFTTGTNFSMSILSLSTDPASVVPYRNEQEMRIAFTPPDGNFKWFTPSQWSEFNFGDKDLGSGGLLLLPPLSGANGETRNLMIGGGKGGFLYLLDRTNLGGNIPDPNASNPNHIVITPNSNAVQQIMEPGLAQIFTTPTYFNGEIYYGTGNAAVVQRAVAFDSSLNSFISPTEITSSSSTGVPSFTSGNFISASSPTTNGVVWQVSNGIRAWDARDVTNTIFSSTPALPDGTSGQCQSATWALPIVDNAKIFFSCFQPVSGSAKDAGDNKPAYLFVYGQTPTVAGAPVETVSNLTATAVSSNQITLNWSVTASSTQPDIHNYTILRSTGDANNFGTINTSTTFGATSFTDTNLNPNTTYFYEVQATNQDGPGSTSASASATTFPQFEEQGLVAYWPLDEGVTNTNATTSVDATGHGHLAQKGENSVEEQPQAGGLINGSWKFHGTNTAANLQVADAPDLDFTSKQSFSLSAWIFPFDSVESGVVVKSADQGALYGLYISNGNLVARGPMGDLVGPPASTNVWTHVALIQDGVNGVRNLYVNGVKQPNTAPAQNANGQGQLWFGDQNNQAILDGYHGLLDEVRIYNRALSQSDVNDLMADPILQVNSLQPSGPHMLPVSIFPSPVPLTEPREPANNLYTLQVTFATPVAAVPHVTLQGQPGVASATGQVGNVSLDPTNTVMTVQLTGVANAQALDLHISNINTPSGVSNAIQDIPFNVFIGDLSQDHVVDSVDTTAITGNPNDPIPNTIPSRINNPVTAANAIFDLNDDGVIDSNDVAVITNAASTTWTAPGDTNLAFFKLATASSTNGNNNAQNAFDNNLNDNWESKQAGGGIQNTGVPGVDPSFVYVNLKTPATVDGFAIHWGGSGALDYTIDACTVTPDNAGNCSAGWQNMVTATNGINNQLQSYNDLPPVTAQYFRMNGTVRVNAPFGYQIDEFYVFGSYNAGTTQPASVTITSATNETATVGQPFPTYTITSNPVGVSYSATNLPGGLTLDTTSGKITGTPTTPSANPINVGLSSTDAAGQTGTATLTLTINAPTPTINSASTETATAGVPFPTYTITTTVAAVSFGATNLPAGLTLNSTNGQITGTPTTASATPIIVGLSATNSTGQTGTATLTLTINASVPTLPAPPTGVTASAVSSTQVNLNWTASTTPGVTYAVFRSTASGFTPGASTQVGPQISATTFSDTGLTPSTSYFYIVETVNSAALVAQSPQVSATTPATTAPTPFTEVLAINAGSQTVVPNPNSSTQSFIGDTDTNTLNGTDTVGNSINVTAPGAAPELVYQSAHQGNFTYTIPGLTNGQTYTVVLHFAELFWTKPNQRQFNVLINGTQQALTNFDIVQEAGSNFTAVVETIPNIPAINGVITIAFNGTTDQPMLNGIEIQTGGNPIPSAPTGLKATTGSTTQVNLSWTASVTSGVTYNVYRSTTPGFIPTAATTPVQNVQGTTFSDTGLTPQTVYYYIVEAVTGGKVSSPPSQHAPALTLAPSGDAIAIDAGGSMVVGQFLADTDFVGGGIDTTNNPINTAGVVGAGPTALYQSARQGNVVYTIPASALTPGKTNYTVVLHFAELFFNHVGQRVFNITINGTQVQPNFDIFAAANNANFTAVVETYPNIPLMNGQIVIAFTGVSDQPMVNGIEIQ